MPNLPLTINAVVREFLARYVRGGDGSGVRRRLLELSDRTDAGSGSAGRSWTREDLYRERGGRTGGDWGER